MISVVDPSDCLYISYINLPHNVPRCISYISGSLFYITLMGVISVDNKRRDSKKGTIRDLPKKKYIPPKKNWDNVPKPKPAQYIQLLGSPAHTYGNALAFIQNYILGLFPKDLFKTIHVNSKIAHRQLKYMNQEFIKKLKPMIVFRPRVGGPDEDRFLKGTLMTENMTNLYYTYGGTNLQAFIHDDFNKFDLKFQLNRFVMTVDVVCIFATFMQQLNYVHYLQNILRLNTPFFLQTHLESYVPQEILKVMSDLIHIPMYDENGYTRDFLTYLNQRSAYPITHKLSGSNGKKEYFRLYPVNIVTTFSDLTFDEGEKTGQVASQYQVNFSVKLEFYGTGFYFLIGEDMDKYRKPIEFPDDSTVIPLYTDVITEKDIEIKQGWSLYNQASCILEKKRDAICINEMLNESIRKCIEYSRLNGLPMLEFIDIIIRRQGEMLKEGIDYEIDYDTMVIQFYNNDNYRTYRIVLAVNMEYINNLLKDLLDDHNIRKI